MRRFDTFCQCLSRDKPTKRIVISHRSFLSKYRKLQPESYRHFVGSFAEKVVLGHFLVLVVLWQTRSPGFIPGWSKFFVKG